MAAVDLRTAARDGRRPGLVLVYEEADPVRGAVALYGCDGTPRWRLKARGDVADVRLLDGNRILMAETEANRVTERDLQGTVFWSYRADGPATCQRLPNGNTFIACYQGAFLEATADGKRLYAIRLVDTGVDPLGARKLPGGRILVGPVDAGRPPWAIEEIKPPADQASRRLVLGGDLRDCCGLAPLPAGGYVVCGVPGSRSGKPSKPGLTTFHSNGTPVAHFEVDYSGPPEALDGGGILVPCRAAVVETDARGQLQWEAFTADRVTRAHDCLPLVRFGFGTRPGTDLANSLEYRVRGLHNRRALIRARSAYALAALGARAQAALPALVELLADPDDLAQGGAAEAIASIGPAAVPGLVKALSDPRGGVRAGCALLLRDFPTRAHSIVTGILPLVRDPEARVRTAAVMALGGMASEAKQVVPVLVLAASDSAAEVRAAAVMSLGYLGPGAAPAVPFLVRCLRSREDRLAYEATEALGRLGPVSPKVIPALVARLDDERLAASAAHALGVMGAAARPAVPALIDALRRPKVHEADKLRATLLISLGQLGEAGQEAVPAIASVLEDQACDLVVRGRAAWALRNLGTHARSAIPGLVATAQDARAPAEVRVAAIRALARIGDPGIKALEALRQLAEARDPVLAGHAAGTLAALRRVTERRQKADGNARPRMP